MSNIQLFELLANTKANSKTKIKPSQNFILELLKNTEPKKAIKLLKDLKLTKEEIQKIILKLPQKKQKLYLEILKNLFIEKIKIDKSNVVKIDNNLEINIQKLLKHINKTQKKDKKNIQNDKITKTNQYFKDKTTEITNILNLLFINEKNIPQPIKKEIKNLKNQIVKILKKEIESEFKINNRFITKKTITEIKTADSFEKLITIANKNGLNIKKIITKIIKPSSKEKKSEFLFPKPKIPVLKTTNIKNHNKQKIDLISKNLTNKDDNIITSSKKEINIQTLLNKNIKKAPIKKENKIDNFNNFEIITKPQLEIKHKIIQAKESIKHFSNNLKEAIENYKPPISKLSIELHPKELGKVDITIIHRGDNLQININSNNQAINFFHTHQIELKNALVNMGYSGIDMNFNSNHNKENQEKKAFKQYTKNNEENYDELIIEIPYTYA